MSKDISRFLKIKIEVHDNFNIGPGKIALMESIISCGSISSAAKKMGMSYRKAWKLVNEINNASNSKIILTNTGGKGTGGTKVSPDGISFIKAFRNIEKKVFKSKKFFYVSPFFEVTGSYELKFKISKKSIHLIIIYKEKEKLIFFADFHGKSLELNNLNLLKVVIFKPFQNIKATLGIYFEALKLWIKGAIYYKKPKKPKKFFSKINYFDKKNVEL